MRNLKTLTSSDWKKAHGVVRSPTIPLGLSPEVFYLTMKGLRFINLVGSDLITKAEPYHRQGARLVGRIGSIRGGVYTSRMNTKPKLPV